MPMSSNTTKNTTQATGRVYLVGAGPGDPGLITLRGVECLQRADVVLYDYLVNPRILAKARATSEKICLGQHGHSRIWSQQEINEALVRFARQGKTVVRLKGGDPAVFARAADEIHTLSTAGIPFEMIPGITAALATGSYAGIPLTHREHASAVALVTGHEDSEKQETAIDYDALAAFPGTLVIYMGVTTARTWSQALIAAGKSPDTPAAIIRRCSCPDQRVVRCRLADIADQIDTPPRIRPPAIVVVGPVAKLQDGVSWFERRPLFGQRIVVTRPIEQADQLSNLLEELGAEVLLQPAIRIAPPSDCGKIDDALDRLDQFDWLVFSSANGVRMLLQRLLETGRDLRALGKIRIAAIGPGTGEGLGRFHLRADVIPDEFRAESLGSTLANSCQGQRFLLARASRGREVLAETLVAAGATVDQIVVYESSDITEPDAEIAKLLTAGRIHWITVTSSAIARSLARMFGQELRHAKLASMSPVTSATLRELGFEPSAEAQPYTMQGLVNAIAAKSM